MDQVWNENHEMLQQAMKKEIETMREILANMHQEKHSLLIKDKTLWQKVVEERAPLILRLSDLREARIKSTEKLEALAFPHTLNEEVPLEKLLPPQDDRTCDVLSMRDQMAALIERLNHQTMRNEVLYDLAQHTLEHPQPKKPKPKISIATLPPDESS